VTFWVATIMRSLWASKSAQWVQKVPSYESRKLKISNIRGLPIAVTSNRLLVISGSTFVQQKDNTEAIIHKIDLIVLNACYAGMRGCWQFNKGMTVSQ
jgi:hypothetical protein